MATAMEMLDLSTVSGRSDKFRFKLLDRDLTILGDIYPLKAGGISNQTGGGIKRKIDSLELLPSDQAQVNTMRERIRPYLVLSDGTEYSCGIFRWADESLDIFSYGKHSHGVLVDDGAVLEQGLQQFLGFTAGQRVVDCVATICATLNITNTRISSDSTVLSSDLYWPPGPQVTYGAVCTELLALAPLYDWYFDNNGRFTVRGQTVVDDEEPELLYVGGATGRMIAGTIVESSDKLGAPNRYIALDTSATNGAVLGTYDLPSSSDNSYDNRGFYIPEFISLPGVGDSYTAYLAAKSAYEQDRNTFKTIEFSSPVDPRHDTFDVIGYDPDGVDNIVNYLEIGWTMPFETGGLMRHTVRRVETE